MSKTITNNLRIKVQLNSLLEKTTTNLTKNLRGITLFTVIMLGISNLCFAQPINDDCSGAIELNVTAERAYEGYTNQLASATTGVSTPNCGSYSGADVWFKIKVPETGKLRIDGSTSINPNIALALYTNYCGSLQFYDCSDVGPQDNASVRLNVVDIDLKGKNIFLRVFRIGSTSGGEFKISAYQNNTAQPINDECTTAIELSNEKRTFEFQTFTTEGAKPASQQENSPCGFSSKKDVWFKAVVPESGRLVIETNSGTINPKVVIYTGNCNGLVYYGCSEDGMTDEGGEVIIDDESMAWEVIYIRVSSGNQFYGTFDILVLEPKQDKCVDAIVLNDISQLENYVAYTNQYADILNDGAEPTCGSFIAKDIWFKIKVPGNGQLVIETKVDEASGIMPVLTVYTGSCGDMESYYACNFWGSTENPFGAKISIDDNLLANKDIYIRMYAYNNSDGGVFRMTTIQPTALPVELTSFRADVVNNAEVVLNWTTATELNNDHFVIEHSTDGQSYTPIGHVDGKGTTDLEQSYIYVDDEPFFGVNYYRLKQIDFDGKFEYSNIISAVIKMEESKINLFPNPASVTSGINVRWIGDFGREQTQLHITNAFGKLVYAEELDVRNVKQSYIDLSVLDLDAGIYYLTINDGNALILNQIINLIRE